MPRYFSHSIRNFRRRVLAPFQSFERKLKKSAERFVVKTIAKQSLIPSSPTVVHSAASDSLPLSTMLGYLTAANRTNAHTAPRWTSVTTKNGLHLVEHPVLDFCYVDSSNLRTLPWLIMGKYQQQATVLLEHHIGNYENIVHVGAEHGFHSLTIANALTGKGKMLALESCPIKRDVLLTNFDIHRLRDRVQVPSVDESSGVLDSFLKEMPRESLLIYVTEDAPIPQSWLADLKRYADEEKNVSLFFGDTFESKKAWDLVFQHSACHPVQAVRYAA